MAIRDKALQSEAFNQLKHVYDNRDSYLKTCREKGRKLIATMGCDVPDEILIAAGYLPVRVYGDIENDLKDADQYLEYSFDPVIRSQFQRIVDGTYHELCERIVISNSTDALIRIYFYLREIHNIEPNKKVPPVYFIDWLFTRTRMHQVRNEGTVERFIEEVEGWIGRELQPEEIIKASEICNNNRRALREFSKLRKGQFSKINGSEALVVIGSALFMDKEEQTKLVKQVIEDADKWDVVEGPKIFMTGSVQENTTLYDLIEEVGAVIVSEDHDWGDRHIDRDVDTKMDPVKAIVDRYMLRMFSSKKAFVSQRVESLVKAVEESEAEGVLFYFRIYEDSPSWDYPEQKAALRTIGKEEVCFEKQGLSIQEDSGDKDRMIKFVNDLKGGVNNEGKSG